MTVFACIRKSQRCLTCIARNKIRLKNKQNEFIDTPDETARVWKGFTSSLFNDDSPEKPTINFPRDSLHGSPIILSEEEYTMKAAKFGKVPLGQYPCRFTGEIVQSYLQHGTHTIGMAKSLKTTKCKDHCPISLMSQTKDISSNPLFYNVQTTI